MPTIQSFNHSYTCCNAAPITVSLNMSQHPAATSIQWAQLSIAQPIKTIQNDSSGSGFQWLTNQQNVRYLPLPPKKKHKKNNM
jgi:hypothetical protein